MDRLDRHRDNWREVEVQIDLGSDLPLPEAVNLKVVDLFINFLFNIKLFIFINTESRSIRNDKWKKESTC